MEKMEPKAIVIPGEAPESDDESVNITTGIGFPTKRTPRNPCGTIISGEAPESDDDGMSLSSVSGAIEATVCQPYSEPKIPSSKKHSVKYNSLLHRKLRDCNEALDKDLLETCESSMNRGVQELTGINRHLLRSELTLQDAAGQLHNASSRVRDIANLLHHLTEANFLHTVKIMKK